MEIIGGNWKTYLGIGMMFNWATGYCLLPLLAYLVPNWKYLQLALTVPLPIFVVIFWFIPECPRWLVTKGKLDEANEMEHKLESAISLYDGFIEKLIEKIGRGFIIGTVGAY